MKRLVIVFLLLLLFAEIPLPAQNTALIDSLKAQLPSDDDQQNLIIYNNLAWEYRKSYPDSTLFYGNKSLAIGTDTEYEKYTAKTLNVMGLGYYYLGENLEAYEFFNKAKESALLHNDSLEYGYALNNLGRIYFNQGNYISAYNYFQQALKVYQSTGDNSAISYGFKSLAELHQSQNDLPKALEMSLQTAELREVFDDRSGVISIYLEIAGIYVKMKNYDDALSYFSRAYELAEEMQDRVNLAIIKLSVSEMNTSREQLEIALLNAREALAFAANSNNISMLIKVSHQLGLIHFHRNDFENAEIHFEKVKEMASENNSIIYERDAFLYLSKIYDNRGQTKQSFDHFKSYTALKEITENLEAAREIQKMESRVALAVKEKENQMLKLNEATFREVIRNQRQLNIALAIIALLIVGVLIIIWFTAQKRSKLNNLLLSKNREIEDHQLQITEQNVQIKNKNDHLLLRNKELADLNKEKDSLLGIVAHDLKSPFNRIKGLAELLRLSSISKEQEQYVEMIRNNAKHGTYLINDLLDVNAIEVDQDQPVPSTINLKDLLETQASNFIVEFTNKEIDYTIDCEKDLYVSSDKVYLNRILDNLISNAIKFSHLGSQISLKAGKNEHGFWIAVKDYGQGFTEEDQLAMFGKFKKLSARPTGGESSNGLGLAIVKTLTDRLEGKISLLSKKGEYSEFTLHFPFLTDKIIKSELQ